MTRALLYAALAIILAYAVCAHGQTALVSDNAPPVAAPSHDALVIQITTDEAKEAADLYAQRAKADEALEHFWLRLKGKYIVDWRQARPGDDSYKLGNNKSGWENGFKFSSDFRFIVPAPLTSLQVQGNECAAPLYFTNPVTQDWRSSIGCVANGSCVKAD